MRPTLSGLKSFFEFDEPWNRAVKRQLGANDTTNPPQLVLNTVTFRSNGQKKTILAGTMVQKMTPESAGMDSKDPKKSYVTIKVMNQADATDPLMPDKGHGTPSKYAGETFTVPYNVYLWMIQPGQSPQAQPPQDPSMAGMDMGQGQAPAPDAANNPTPPQQ